jgi:hypothetical protein
VKERPLFPSRVTVPLVAVKARKKGTGAVAEVELVMIAGVGLGRKTSAEGSVHSAVPVPTLNPVPVSVIVSPPHAPDGDTCSTRHPLA